MSKTDSQLKSNDCGISAIKTVFTIFEKNISRKYIESHVAIEQKGSRISDIKDFFDQHGFQSTYQLLDFDISSKNEAAIDNYFPFIIPFKRKNNLHYLVADGRKGNQIRVHDPSKGEAYYLPYQELKNNAHYTKTDWSYVQTDDQVQAVCAQIINEYALDLQTAITENGSTQLFNKLSYFSYLRDTFGFKNDEAEKSFLIDLLKNQDIAQIPTGFKTLQLEKGKIKNTAPVVLCVQLNATQSNAINYPEEEKSSLYWDLFKKLGSYKKLWYIYIFAALFSAITAQIAVFTNQILIDNVLPTYNLSTLVLFSIGLGIYKLFDLFTTLYKNFVSIHLGNALDRFFLFSFDEKINSSSLSYIHTYKKGDLMERVSDSMKLKSFFMKFFTGILVDVIVAVYSLFILFLIDKSLTFIVLIVMVLFILWFKFITPYLKQNERMRYIRKADFVSKMMEKVEGIQVIKSVKIERFYSN
ncbi:MAG: hypothetical protein KA325_09755, partial [Flavobacterium sp.]|nr:hypothetical protein [Flavobacterium sp.]